MLPRQLFSCQKVLHVVDGHLACRLLRKLGAVLASSASTTACS